MQAARAKALFLMAVLVFWTVMPALACLPPAAPHDCCQGAMQGCVQMDKQACCQVHAPGQAVPPTVVNFVDPFAWIAMRTAAADASASGGNPSSGLHLADASPSPPFSGASSILRI